MKRTVLAVVASSGFSLLLSTSALAVGPSPAKVYRGIKGAKGDVVSAHAKFYNPKTKLGGVVASHKNGEPTYAVINLRTKTIVSERKLGGAAVRSTRAKEGIKTEDGPVFVGDVNGVRGGLGDVTRRGNVRTSTGDEVGPQNVDFVTIIREDGKVQRTQVDPTTEK
jgi:hypothetical protein